MHLNINPIEKHKSEIEKRISQLQEKFRESEAPKAYGKRNRDHLHDQNKSNYPPGYAISRTVEVRGKIKAQGQGKTNRESCYRPVQAKQPLSETGLIRNIKESKQPKVDSKDEKIKQLYDMMQLILEGQKNIEKEINQLKQENTKESVNKSKIDGQTSFIQHQTPLQSSLEKLSLSKQRGTDKSNNKLPASNNQSMLIREKVEHRQIKPKQKKAKVKKDYDLEGYLEELKGQCIEGHRYCVGQQWKARIWAEVQGRVKQSEKEYKDTIHRNNKHQYDHLINTFELQRKLKDDLIDKVYQQCNPQIYK